ncbi:TIGR01906 family membrane protein [Clostridium chauvoei]|uniref:TIGR01906 family membrane protein n=2 Tax=Clostridium chauvoei TaxID=46867 RepID=A0ABD4REQ0_9CLOT|nr:hypothetical protein BTM20_03960 [Clostridium chauvoei]ATD58719.1 hypothetical protein BTM21_09100 [Clostridium chauvoei]MBX7279672.1 TIGR01906 family membrane protein [Clostridium chauvoei]MBX7282041.1 TIGR01906 family membrane protein [Clostridium chauvoei]MBX7284563.1 TIGR01906 family membrane protein [Clostridium chauvoei]
MFLSFITSIFAVGISVIITLNLTIVYKIAIDKFNLVKITGLSKEKLMFNYNGMIKYLNNPFIKQLEFEDFSMSRTGEIHFQEVKNIFMKLYIIVIIALLIFITFKLVKALAKNIEFPKVVNYAANIILITFGFVMASMGINFSKTFVLFHKLFFNNNYWIFDPKTDPVINALPEELFLVYAIIIIVLLGVQVIAFKMIYIKSKPIKSPHQIIKRFNI